MICGVMIAVYAFNFAFQGALFSWGLVPRQFKSLPGIYAAPFLHGSLGHLVNNLIGLVIFSSLLFVHSLKHYLWSSFFIITLTGLLVWLFARPALHIGASGWVFGLWSLLIATAWFDRKLINILLAVVVAFFYGGMLYGVLPTDPRISFESHLFGVVAGVFCALFQKKLFNNKM